MSLNLPSLPPLPEVLKKVEEVKDEKFDVVLSERKIVILYTKEITAQDLEMIRRHGKAIFFNSSLINIDLKKIDADYILCDASDESCLRSLEKHFNDDKDNIDFCAYCRFYEKTHFEDKMNCFSCFKDGKDKDDFDFQLLNKKNFKKVNSVISCLSFLVNSLASLKK